jgi:hypothetical protein
MANVNMEDVNFDEQIAIFRLKYLIFRFDSTFVDSPSDCLLLKKYGS